MVTRKSWRRWIAAALAAGMMMTSLPMTAFAEDSVTANEVTQEVTQEQAISDEQPAQVQEAETQEAVSEVTEETGEAADETAVTAQQVQSSNEVIDYVYIDKPFVQTPDTQSIAVALKDAEGVQNASLTVVNQTSGEETELAASMIEENMILFSNEYADETQSGSYALQSLKLEVNGAVTEYRFSDLGIDGQYGVNEEVATTPDQTIEKETDESEAMQDVEVSVQTMNTDGTFTEEASIEDGITDVLANGTTDAENGITTMSEDNSIDTQSGPAVVVLDPGHDDSHTGASAYGYHEQDLTLKIATYCKQELESYYNVKVYMTRSTSACAWPGTTTAQCLQNRAALAASVKANLFVSFHLNSSDSTTARGAEVYYASSTTYPGAQTESIKTAQQIAAQLSKIGLYLRNSGTGINTSDFSVLRNSIASNIPAVLIEHCFISNASEVQSYLSTASGLQRLGQADAAGIANYLALAKGDWHKDSKGWWFRYSDGSYPKSCWAFIGGDWYHFDANGYMQTGWLTVGSNQFLLREDGRMITGWLLLNGNWYYFKDDGVMAKGWVLCSDGWYYTNPSTGVMQTGWLKKGSTWYYLKKSGLMAANGWLYNNNIYYYMDGSGAMVTSRWLNDNGTWYYVGADGAMKANRWSYIDNQWFHFKADGRMSTGWVLDGSTWYYVGANGAMKSNGWFKINGKYYYLDGSGKMVSYRWLYDGGTGYWYFVDKSGAMKSEEWLDLNGSKYYFVASGAMVTGWGYIGGTWYYFNKGRNPEGLMTHTGLTSIMGQNGVDMYQMAKMFNSKGKTYPSAALSAGGAGDIYAFCQIVYQEAEAEGVKAEVVFAQAMLETGYLQFGGDVDIKQFNFAGIGATGNGAKGNSFSSVREGIRAQVQHLKAYASKDSLNQGQVDPRFTYVSRGCAPYVEWLGMKENPTGAGWAASMNYGFNLVDDYINPIYSK